MPDPVPKKRRSATDEPERYVRVRDGTLYGPVPLSELTEWAESGNIMPGDEISADNETWSLAATLPDLCMDVMIDRGDGAFLGPFNAKAVEPLIKTGAIQANAKRLDIRELSTNNSASAQLSKHERDLELQAQIEEQIEAAAQQARDVIAERDREIETLQEALAEKDEALAAAQAQTNETKQNGAHVSELEKEFAELLEFSNTRDAEYAAKLKEKEKALASAEREFAKNLTKWQAANSSLNHRIKELERGAGSLFN